MIQYHPPLFRPPSEADSLILQATLGCSHNRCTFCGMYRTKRFRPRPLVELKQEIAWVREVAGDDVRRVFLADGDAMCLSARRLRSILEPLNRAFPHLQRVSAYANARDLLGKTPEALVELHRAKLRLIYMGLESGDPATLERVGKGATPAELVAAVQRAHAAGITTSVMVLIGLAGRERSLVHARASAAVLNAMQPGFTALLTYTPVPGTPFQEQIERGLLTLPSARESLAEIRELLAGLTCRTTFTCNHASNYLPLRGKLPTDRERLLALLDAALANRLPLKPEHLRGL